MVFFSDNQVGVLRLVTVLRVSEAPTAALWFGVLIGHVEASFRSCSEPQSADNPLYDVISKHCGKNYKPEEDLHVTGSCMVGFGNKTLLACVITITI